MVAYRLDINVGNVIDGKYTIAKRIGGGTYGDVFEVVASDNRHYALKLLRLWEFDTSLHESLTCKFAKEYNAARIESEYLVHSLDFGIVEGNPYLLMEYCPKGDLLSLIGKDTSILPHYAVGTLEGLHALHTAGKVHRDLKPENVLIRPNGNAALTDFGVVGEMDKSKRQSVTDFIGRPKEMQGTPLYMAPEMFDRKGGGVTYLPTVDIWSFGVMLYEIITGGLFPFGDIQSIQDTNDISKYQKWVNNYQNNARNGCWNKYRLEHSSHGYDWLYIIDRCLMPNYRERYQSAREVLQDMKPLIGNKRIPVVEEATSRSATITKLLITQGDNIGNVFFLKECLKNGGRMIRVGREFENDIVLPEQGTTFVSRYHFTLERSVNGTYWTIRDGQWRKSERRWVTSTNGTYINATPVTSDGLRVFTGDIITAGEYKIKVE